MSHRSRLTLLVAGALAVSAHADADMTLMALAGAQCDTPQVRDGRSFDSNGASQFAVGGAIGWTLRPRWTIHVEGLYAPRRFTSPAFVSDAALRVDVLEMAALASWRIRPGAAGWGLSVRGGPQVGSRLRARRRFRDSDEDVTSHLREADLKALVAIQVSRRAAGGTVVVEGRLGWGLTNLDDTNQQQIRARAVTALVGYAR